MEEDSSPTAEPVVTTTDKLDYSRKGAAKAFTVAQQQQQQQRHQYYHYPPLPSPKDQQQQPYPPSHHHYYYHPHHRQYDAAAVPHDYSRAPFRRVDYSVTAQGKKGGDESDETEDENDAYDQDETEDEDEGLAEKARKTTAVAVDTDSSTHDGTVDENDTRPSAAEYEITAEASPLPTRAEDKDKDQSSGIRKTIETKTTASPDTVDTEEVVTVTALHPRNKENYADMAIDGGNTHVAQHIHTMQQKKTDSVIADQLAIIRSTLPTTKLEIALKATLDRKDAQIERLNKEINKMNSFLIKRKQTYKRKRKDESAPIRPLSAYNLFIRDRFAKLARQNEEALKSDNADAKLKRVPPSDLIASTGLEWSELPQEEKAKYERRAKADKKRYDEQMEKYDAPENKNANQKRNKTGYNMFFSAHVLRLKASESGVPTERGHVARLVGVAWKKLSYDEKQYYEREADKHNGMNVLAEEENEYEEDDVEEAKRIEPANPYEELHLHPSPTATARHHHQQQQHAAIHYDLRTHHMPYYPPPPMYMQPYAYDYSQHHQRHLPPPSTATPTPRGNSTAANYAQHYGRHYGDPPPS